MQKMINGMTVSRWACINFSRSVQESVARGFCIELAQMCQVSGMVGFFLYQSLLRSSALVLLTIGLLIHSLSGIQSRACHSNPQCQA